MRTNWVCRERMRVRGESRDVQKEILRVYLAYDEKKQSAVKKH